MMGLFGKPRARRDDAEAAPGPVARSADEQALLDVAATGNLDAARRTLRTFEDGAGRGVILDRARQVVHAIDEGRAGEAIALLQAWPSVWEDDLTSRDHRGTTYLGGMLMVDVFHMPGVDGVTGMHDLLVGPFRDLAKEVQLQAGQPFFGDVFAAVMSRDARL